MKKVTFIFVLSCFLMLNCSFAFPTIRQVMNFEVGDIFHYKSLKTVGWNIQQYSIMSREVIGKQYNLDSTSVSYQFKTTTYVGATENGNWCNMQLDTVTENYTNLDSSCMSLYPAYLLSIAANYDVTSLVFSEQANSTYNGRTLVKGMKDTYNYASCAEGLGFTDYSIYYQSLSNLVWYKKGNETYGTPILQFINPQNPSALVLKRGEVFDYSVGDIIQFETYQLESSPFQPAYESEYVTQYKILSRTNLIDSVIYSVERKKQWKSGDTIGAYFSQDTISLNYGKLGNEVADFCKSSIFYSCDSVLMNFVPYEGTYHSSSHNYVKGIGDFYAYRSKAQIISTYQESLTYWFKIAQNKSCGSAFTFDSLYTDSLLRRREVFDFAVGDIFQFERSAKGNSWDKISTYKVERKILAKTETPDKWTYRIQQKQLLTSGYPIEFSFKVDTLEESYDRLDDYVLPIYEAYTTEYNLCESLLANEYRSANSNSSSTNYKVRDVYIKGLGMYHNAVKRPQSDSIFTEELTYYYKAATNKSCGNYVEIKPPLMVREVFDFAVGDVFQFRRFVKNYATSFSTFMVEHKILAKQGSGDVWIYKIRRKNQFIAGDSLGFSIQVDTFEMPYYSINSWVVPPKNVVEGEYKPCESIRTNSDISYDAVNEIQSEKLFIKGLGEYETSFKLPNDSLLVEQLTYYHKVNGNKVCGTAFSFKDLEAPSLPASFIAYHLPADNVIKVKFEGNETASMLEILNFEGQKIYQADISPNQTELKILSDKFSSQLYIVRWFIGEKQYYTKMLLAK